MNIFHPFKNNNKNPGNRYFNNSNRVARIFYRLKTYHRIFMDAIKKGIAVSDLLRAQFPFVFFDAHEPPIVSIEFTNYCNLKCVYCTNRLGVRELGFMSDIVFNRILNDLLAMKPNRIQLVGNGESTLHPLFGEFTMKLAKTGKYLSLVTNGQWQNQNVVEQILKAPIDLIEISVDAGGKEKYESSRVNGSFETLLSNLEHLKKLKHSLNSKTVINIRLMLRPSQKKAFQEEFTFWRKYCDHIMPQYITKINNIDYQEDVFFPIQTSQEDFPKCSLPFKHLEIKYSGEVLMCYYSFYQIGAPGLVIGNVLDSSVNDLWNSKIMKEYRSAHRGKRNEKRSICKGCPGT